MRGEEKMYKEYAKTTGNALVTELYLDLDREPDTGDICVNTYDDEYKFERHCNTILQDQDGRYNYKVSNGKLIERTEEEKARDTRPLTQDEINAMLMLELAKMKARENA